MKYTAVSVRQLDRKGKPWQARAKYKDAQGKWKELSKMLSKAKGKRDALRMAKEWLDAINAEADLMPNVLEAVYLDFEPQDPMYVGILLAFYAGLRRGEICGLRWNDIDFNRHTIRIRSAVGVSEGKGLGD